MESLLNKRSLLRAAAALFMLTLLLGSVSGSSVAQAPVVAQVTGMAATFDPPVGKVTLGDYEADIFVPPPDNGGLDQAPAAATFSVAFIGAGWTVTRTNAFNYATSIWAASITSTVPISVEVQWQDLGYAPTGYTLGYGGACDYYPLLINGTWTAWFPNALANKLLGYDAQTAECDVQNTFNSNTSVPWYYGTDGNPGAGQIDFVTVVIHELGHGLGFIGSMRYDDGNSGNGTECTGTANQGCWGYDMGAPYGIRPFVYDCFTGDGYAYTDNLLTDTGVYANPSAALGTALTSGSVYFGGLDVTLDSGNPDPNRNVILYAPATWSPGSSYAHWDEATFPAGNPNSLMTPQLGSAEANHNPGSLTLALFDDIGWDGTLPDTCTAADTLNAVTVKSIDASSSLSQSGDVKNAAILPWVPAGLGVAAMLGTSIWLIARRRKEIA